MMEAAELETAEHEVEVMLYLPLVMTESKVLQRVCVLSHVVVEGQPV